MARKAKISISPAQKLEYAKLMVDDGYTNKKIQDISGACLSAVSRWKRQYKSELEGITPEKGNALTFDQQRIQELEKQLKRAKRDNEILKKAAAFFIRDNPNLS
jgi:transposase